MSEHRPLVLFDFDGVIADSFSVAYGVMRHVCAHITEEEYRGSFEGNVNDYWERNVFDQSHGPECHHDIEWFSEFIPAFEKNAQMFAGMREVIESLSHQYTLIVISSTITSPIQAFLEKNHIGRYFSEVMGNDVHTHKDEKIRMVFEKYQAHASKCVFVTDSLGDMREATKVNVGSIGVSWGFHPRETLAKGAPFRIVEKAGELPLAVSDYFASIHSQ